MGKRLTRLNLIPPFRPERIREAVNPLIVASVITPAPAAVIAISDSPVGY